MFIDASAQVVTINHVPQDYDQFVEGATVVGSVDQLIGAIENGTLPYKQHRNRAHRCRNTDGSLPVDC